VVIVGVTQLDTVLEEYLSTVLQPGDNKELFDWNGPLGTTSSKIIIARRLGIIDKDVKRALDLARKIRNSFAHTLASASLSESPHKERLHELVKLCEKNEAYHDMRKNFTDLLKREDLAEEIQRGQFSESLLDFASVMCVVLYSLISVRAISQRVEPSHRATLDW